MHRRAVHHTQFRQAGTQAATYLQRLFEFAFAIRKDGLILLPGQYNAEPITPVLADLQSGLTLTFLQHGKVRKMSKESNPVSYDPDGDGIPGVVVEYRQCMGLNTRKAGTNSSMRKGQLSSGEP